jgi:hypothetical protein
MKKLTPYKCKSCKGIAAETNGQSLFIDGKLVQGDPYYIAFPCAKCGAKVRWHRSEPQQAVGKCLTKPTI